MKKLFSFIIGLGLALGAFAQATPAYAPYTGGVTGSSFVKKYYNASHVATYITSDTVTNTGTANLLTKTPIGGSYTTVAITWTATKISGTVAGTLTLYGSVDGKNYVAITGNLGLNQTSIATFTPTDVATQTKTWILQNNPYSWYEVSWTGAGTMAASQTASIVMH